MTLAVDHVEPPRLAESAPTRYAITVTMLVTATHPPDPVDALRELVGHLASATGTPPADDGTPIVVDVPSRTVARGTRTVELSRREFDLLRFLAEHPARVFTRTQLLDHVWGDRFTGSRTVDVHVRRIRQKLGAHSAIATVRGVGYRLAAAAPVTVRP